MPKTKHREIVDYWSCHQDECGLSIDWAEAHERCWRCGYKAVLHRCHIIPDSMQGIDEPSNLVLLCVRCHREAPNINDPQFMWIWIRAHGTPFYDTFWTIRGFEEFEKMFGRKAFAQFAMTGASSFSDEHIRARLREEMELATIHFGEGRLNPSTIACVIYRVEQRLLSTTFDSND